MKKIIVSSIVILLLIIGIVLSKDLLIEVEEKNKFTGSYIHSNDLLVLSISERDEEYYFYPTGITKDNYSKGTIEVKDDTLFFNEGSLDGGILVILEDDKYHLKADKYLIDLERIHQAPTTHFINE